MARDYSGQRNQSQRKNNSKGGGKSKPQQSRRKPATRPASKRKKNTSGGSGGPPGWVWLLCGLCIGLTVAAGFYMFGRPAGTGARQQIEIATPEAADNAQQSADPPENTPDNPPATSKEKEPRFSFYKMLPNYEVVIPEEEYPDDAGDNSSESSTAAASSSSETQASVAQPTTPRVEEPGRYIIQAGSFSTRGDADRRKAEIALLGVNARIVSVDLPSGKTVYRVQSHTIDSSDKLNNLLKRLRKNRIDTLVMRAKK